MRQAEAQPTIVNTDRSIPADPPKPVREKRTKRPETTSAKPQSAPRFTASPPVPAFDLATPEMPSREEIRERAYFIYVARNGGPGSSESDWLQAERELLAERCANAKSPARRRI